MYTGRMKKMKGSFRAVFAAILAWAGLAIRGVLWEFIGLRMIYEKVVPPPPGTGRRPASTFFLWGVSIYVALVSGGVRMVHARFP
jgi:hypothetical protein